MVDESRRARRAHRCGEVATVTRGGRLSWPGIIHVALVVVLFVMAGCANAPGAPIPGRWGDGDGAVVALRPDGEGEVEGVPFGDGDECADGNLELSDGDVEGEQSEPGEIHLRSGDDVITLWADRGGFGGDIRWYKVVVGLCGDGTGDAQKVVYTRYDDFNDGG